MFFEGIKHSTRYLYDFLDDLCVEYIGRGICLLCKYSCKRVFESLSNRSQHTISKLDQIKKLLFNFLKKS